MKYIKTCIVGLLIIFNVTSLFAQQSNTNRGTAGTVRKNIDKYMDVQYFSDVTFNNFLTFTNFYNYGSHAEFGYAKDFGKFFLGTYLNGTLWSSSKVDKTSINNINSHDNYATNSNRIDALFGFNNMAFKLGYITNLSLTSSNNTTKYDTNGNLQQIIIDNSEMFLSCYLSWGSTYELGKLYLKPYAKVGYEYGENSSYSTENTKRENNSKKYNNINFALGLDFDIKNKSKFHSLAGFKSSFYFDKYNYYDYRGFNTNNNYYITAFIDPYYKLIYSLNERLQINTKINILTKIGGSKIMDAAESNILLKGMLFSLAPTVRLGLNYEIKPETLAVNIGTFIKIPELSINKIESTDGKTSTFETKTGNINVFLDTGIDWNITKTITLDMAMTIPIAPNLSSTIINSFSIGINMNK